MQDRIYELLVEKDEVTWQSIIYELVKNDEMDPWDIDVSLLANRYIGALKTLKKMNFFVSGKVLLAASVLLRLKSDSLLLDKIALFDSQLFDTEETLEDLEEGPKPELKVPDLILRTPLPRKRKVTLQELISALHKALEINKRRILKREGEQVHIALPQNTFSITEKIKEVFERIKDLFIFKERVTLAMLVNSPEKRDVIMTFVPLLHLTNQHKIDLEQQEHFGEIEIKLIRKGYY